MLTVITPAATTKLCMLADVKRELGISDSSQDALLNDLIQQVSDAIVAHCGRPFARETYRETVPGYGGQLLTLSRTPIVSVTTVLHSSEPIVDYTIENPEAGFLYRERGWQWTASLGWGLTSYVIPNSEHPKLTVEYTAGYLLPDQAEANLPGDIERAAIESVVARYQTVGRDPTVTEVEADDIRVRFARDTASAGAIPVPALTLLSRWVRVV